MILTSVTVRQKRDPSQVGRSPWCTVRSVENGAGRGSKAKNGQYVHAASSTEASYTARAECILLDDEQ